MASVKPTLEQELFSGMTVTRLGQLFGKDKKTVQVRLGPVVPNGERNGTPIYLIADAAPYLCDPVVDLNEYIMTVKPSQLPPQLNKAYWSAQREKQRYYEENGDLWSTHKVYSVVSEILKIFRETVRNFADEVDSNAVLSDEQRKVLNALGDDLLDQTRTAVEKAFKDYNGINDHEPQRQTDEFGSPLDEFGLPDNGVDEFGIGSS